MANPNNRHAAEDEPTTRASSYSEISSRGAGVASGTVGGAARSRRETTDTIARSGPFCTYLYRYFTEETDDTNSTFK